MTFRNFILYCPRITPLTYTPGSRWLPLCLGLISCKQAKRNKKPGNAICFQEKYTFIRFHYSQSNKAIVLFACLQFNGFSEYFPYSFP